MVITGLGDQDELEVALGEGGRPSSHPNSQLPVRQALQRWQALLSGSRSPPSGTCLLTRSGHGARLSVKTLAHSLTAGQGPGVDGVNWP